MTTPNDQNQKERIYDMKKPGAEQIEDSHIDKSLIASIKMTNQATLE